MVVAWECRVVTYLLHVLLLYDQSWCQFWMGRWQGGATVQAHYCLLGNAPKSKHCSKNCALESSLRIKSCRRRFCFVSQPYSSVLSTGECFYFKEFFVCSQSGNHPQEDAEEMVDHPQEEDLAKSGYKPTRNKVQIFTFSSNISGYKNENQIHESGKFNIFFPSLLMTENLKIHFYLFIYLFNFLFWRYFASLKKAGTGLVSPLRKSNQSLSIAWRNFCCGVVLVGKTT